MIIERTEHYEISDTIHYCCDEMQFTYFCNTCDEKMDCYFCGFDYTKSHECRPTQGSKG